MPTESRRHFLLSPLAGSLARLFLLEHRVQTAKENELSSQLQEQLLADIALLRSKLELMEQRIDAETQVD